MTWGGDDVRIIGDIVVGSILASGVRLIAVKGVLEPAAVWAFKAGYNKADDLMNDRLPDLPEALGGEPAQSEP